MKVRKHQHQIHELDQDLFQIILPQPFYDQNSVYFIADERPTLIDSGYIESLGQLSSSLKYLGYSLNKIHNIIYTHNHVDHLSGGLLFPVYAKHIKRLGFWKLRQVEDFLLNFHSWIHENERLVILTFDNLRQRQKMQRQVRSYWTNFLKRFESTDRKRGDRFIHLDYGLHEGDRVRTGKYCLKILESPGHNRWHITPIEENKKWLFSGDLIIGNIPAIYNQLDGNLEDYYKTMFRLLGGYTRYTFFPGHGPAIANAEKKIKVILRTLSVMEKNVLKRLSPQPTGILKLVEQMMGNSIASDNHFLVAIALLESILRKLMKEQKVSSILYHTGYEEFFLN